MLEKMLRPARMAMGCQLMTLISTPLVLQSMAAMTMKMMDLRRSNVKFIYSLSICLGLNTEMSLVALPNIGSTSCSNSTQ